jgi:hypothetical protein
MNRYEFGDAGRAKKTPHSLARCSVWQRDAKLCDGMGAGGASLRHRGGLLHAGDDLPLHDTALGKPLCCMLADNVAVREHKLANFVRKASHGPPQENVCMRTLSESLALVDRAAGGRGAGEDVAGRIWFDAMLQLSRTSVFADMAAITVQIAGDTGRFGKDAKRIVRNAWNKVGL